ncbi:MAG TPA: DUF481 domain-containing protein [Bryobacteraceae bacterium]|nr:DUF481 domain-containing protein [Bryobacteraceae bacterium]
MKNGDRLSGLLIRFDGKNLTIKSEFAGNVVIPWEAITDVQTSNPMFIGLEDGQVVVGTMSSDNGTFTIQTKDAGAVSTARTSVKSIRNKDEEDTAQRQIERLRSPRLVDLWTGFVDLGFAQSTGNAITSTINTSANATRATNRDKINAYFTSIYSKNNTTGVAILTANLMRGGVRYSLDVSKKVYVSGSSDLEFDEFQKLDLRFAPAVSFGHHTIKNKNTVFDVFGGGSLNKEFFATGLRRSSGEALFGDELSHKLFGGVTVVHQKMIFFPNLTNQGQYRFNFDFSQATTLRKWLAWQITFSNRFLSNPLPGRKTNDLLITTGFRITFAP